MELLELLSIIQIHFPLLQTILRLNIDGANTNATKTTHIKSLNDVDMEKMFDHLE